MTELSEAKRIKKGEILTSSWGYDQTTNDYCKVLENTGKTIKCQKIKSEKIKSLPQGVGEIVKPNPKIKVCKPFRIRISPYTYGGEKRVSLVGSYPLTNQTDSDCEDKRRGLWHKWDKKEDINTER